jgi:hypothetical protein
LPPKEPCLTEIEGFSSDDSHIPETLALRPLPSTRASGVPGRFTVKVDIGDPFFVDASDAKAAAEVAAYKSAPVREEVEVLVWDPDGNETLWVAYRGGSGRSVAYPKEPRVKRR